MSFGQFAVEKYLVDSDEIIAYSDENRKVYDLLKGKPACKKGMPAHTDIPLLKTPAN